MAKQTFKYLWMEDVLKKIRQIIPKEEFSNNDLKEYLHGVYEKRYLARGRFFNNTTRKNEIMTQEQFIDKFLNYGMIVSGYATLYKNQDEVETIGSAALNFLLVSRKKYKKKMTQAERGTLAYFYYKVLQLTYKLLANSYYGCLGEKNSIFYNPFVQNSITLTGQDLITTSIITLERFLSDNVAPEDLDDVMTFVKTVTEEEKKYNILDYADRAITADELSDYFMKVSKKELNKEFLDKIISKLSDEEITRIYYKNKVLELCAQKKVKEMLREMLKYSFAGEEPEEAMKPLLEEFKNLIIDLCFTDQIIEDRFKRATNDIRHSITTIDTDLIFGSAG